MDWPAHLAGRGDRVKGCDRSDRSPDLIGDMLINLLNLRPISRSEFHFAPKHASLMQRRAPRPWPRPQPRPAFCRVATAPSRWNSAATSMMPPTSGCWRSIGRLPSEPIAGVTETVPTYRSLLVHYDPVQIDFEALGEKLLALARRPVSGDHKGAALAHSRRLWRRARHRPRGCRQDAQHHARRYRGAARRRRLPRRHDRLYAGLVLSQRARRNRCTCRGGRTRGC